ncbi:MAG: GIY-YIG nuclease family protein [Ignavibacteriales bacterium]|nr:GIY-YIG nuclease family protein [Ignavibacteriales bacterium]
MRYRPWKIVFTKMCPSKKEALAAEKKIKSWKSSKMISKVACGEIAL